MNNLIQILIGMIKMNKPPYDQMKSYEIKIPLGKYIEDYKFWTMISTDGRKKVAWMPDNNDSIRPQFRKDKTPVTVGNLIESDVESMLREVVATASTIPKKEIRLEKIIKKNKPLIRRVMQDIKAYK